MSGVQSVDAFLEHRPEFSEIGKACIARGVMMQENPDRLFDADARGQGWYSYLWNILRTPRDVWTDNCLRVVTFNYDRSFECFLWSAVKTTYGLTDEETRTLMLVAPVCHVHGDLGEFDPTNSAGSGTRPYETQVDAASLRLAAERIQIVTESGADTRNVVRAREILADSKRVFFVGLGYHPGNLDKLGVRSLGPSILKQGTAYGMERVERGRVSKWGISLDESGADALQFFRRVVAL